MLVLNGVKIPVAFARIHMPRLLSDSVCRQHRSVSRVFCKHRSVTLMHHIRFKSMWIHCAMRHQWTLFSSSLFPSTFIHHGLADVYAFEWSEEKNCLLNDECILFWVIFLDDLSVFDTVFHFSPSYSPRTTAAQEIEAGCITPVSGATRNMHPALHGNILGSPV